MPVTITLTKKHFDVAYAAVRADKSVTHTCLVAQAIKAAFSKKRVQVCLTTADVGKVKYNLPVKAQRLITRFDGLNFLRSVDTKADKDRAKKLRASLPTSFKMTEQPVLAAA
jgi:hypothetical protein